METYRTPDELFDGLPGYDFAPQYLEQDPARMHYVDEGAGTRCSSSDGEPTWGFLDRKMIAPVAGWSAPWCPTLRLRPIGQAHPDRGLLLRLPLLLERRFVVELDLRESTLVVHDWGGPIGLPSPWNGPERVAQLVILNTGIGAALAPPQDWLRFRGFIRRVDRISSPGQLIRISCVSELPEDVVEAYNAPFPVPESKAGDTRVPGARAD